MLLAETDGGIEMSKKLIAFYSRADDNYVNGLIKTLEVGNTEVEALCKRLQRMYRTGAS